MSRTHRRVRRVTLAVLTASIATPLAVAAPAQATAPATSVASAAGLSVGQVTAQDVCPPASGERASCGAQILVRRSDGSLVRPAVNARALLGPPAPAAARAVAPELAATSVATGSAPAAAPPQPGTPAYLQQAYDLTYLSRTAGGSDTVAIVDAYDDPTAESDLATYRRTYGLAPCTTAGGCFRKVNQSGATAPLPVGDPIWQSEESLDLDAVAALCPNCHILLVEANSSRADDLYAAIATAISLGANQISNSWGSVSSAPDHLNLGGATVLAGTGDSGYAGAGGGAGESTYPAALPGVTAVGGTTLTAATSPTPRGFTESAWSLNSGFGGGSGCDLQEPKPPYQTDSGCAGRAYADVSADGDPSTGLAIYDSGEGGWLVGGGTSLATALVAAYEAVSGIDGATPQWAYAAAGLLNDPATGSTGACAPIILYICNSAAGYDGPTGVGSISGDLAGGAPGIGAAPVSGGSGKTYVTGLTATTASLIGGIYPNGSDTRYFWQFGTSTAYGQQGAAVDAGAGPLPVAAPQTLVGLAPGTPYHYRLIAENGYGRTYGYDYTLTTPLAKPLNLVVPSISGPPRPGATLTVSPGRWSPAGVSFSYGWQRSSRRGRIWTRLTGGGSSSYRLTAADLTADLRVTVSATDPAGRTIVTSAPVGPVAFAAHATSASGHSRARPGTVSARRIGRGRVRVSVRAKPARTILIVQLGRHGYRTRRSSMTLRARGVSTLRVALQRPGHRHSRWMRIAVR